MVKLSPVHLMVTQSGLIWEHLQGRDLQGSSCPIVFCLFEKPALSPAQHQEQIISMQGQLGD